MARKEPAHIVEDAELDWLIKVTKAGQNARRNVAMILTLFGTGMKPGELAGLRVDDILAPDGQFRGGQPPPRGRPKRYYQAEVRAEIAFSAHARPVRWNNRRLTSALDDYFAERLADKRGVWSDAGFRGLNPESPAFLARGTGSTGFSSATVSNELSKLFKRAGVMGGVAGSGRRTLAVKLARKGTDLRVIAEVLGHGSIAAVRKLVAGDTARLGDILKDII